MYKIVGIGKNDIEIELSNEKEAIIFDSEEDASNFLNKINREETLPDGYKLLIRKI
ncbi:hypothetical protein VBD025_05510 [Virgibacillus flavescens]|uniref:hypothetical protein n=1 Tax=Virgibacillus flavescens TaxID=1611422 RepID=UPI003D34D4AB